MAGGDGVRNAQTRREVKLAISLASRLMPQTRAVLRCARCARCTCGFEAGCHAWPSSTSGGPLLAVPLLAVVSTSPNPCREAKDEASGADRLFLTLGPGFLAGILQRDPSLARFLTEIGWVYANRADVPETLSGRSSLALSAAETAEVPRIFGIPPGLLERPAAQGRLPGRAQPLLFRGLGAQLSSFWPRAPGRCESSAASLLISRVSPLYRIVSRTPFEDERK